MVPAGWTSEVSELVLGEELWYRLLPVEEQLFGESNELCEHLYTVIPFSAVLITSVCPTKRTGWW